ncbi:hypothetical protein ASG01_11935 [Chryseobacterium sp. Leaf180]|uniref:hypothetical protein n=1 Tax=Chryseobacterium sp. Leaf180 TaxID=1736289 RepID=UPI0006FEC1F5|nr:hypothetical protein [Chryseobacterium sp. Leaf180]KQR92608.1 hypothetical protein ASG01_11935 [Chryseobacterium sp. Leaf180]
MKKLIGMLILILVVLSCNTQKVYSDYDISYSKSGGYAPVYENLLIKGTDAYYSFEGKGKKTNSSFKLTSAELQKLDEILSEKRFRFIEEDHKKVYDRMSVTIVVKNGKNSASKTDAGFILAKDQKNWAAITGAFQEIISKKVKNTP